MNGQISPLLTITKLNPDLTRPIPTTFRLTTAHGFRDVSAGTRVAVYTPDDAA